MTYSYIIVIDQGTHSTRAIIYDKHGENIFHSKRSIELTYIKKHYVEQDGAAILASCQQVLSDAHDYIQTHQLTNVAVALTTQRSTVISWHSKSGVALSPALSWLDTRAQDALFDLHLNEQEIRSKTGLQVSAHYGASKLRWLLEHNEQVRSAHQQQTLLMGPLAAFLIFNLLDNHPAYVDYANAHRTLLWNIHSHDWDNTLLDAFSIDSQLLPTPVPNTFNYGKLNTYKYPLVLVNGDQNSAVYGYAQRQSDSAFVNIGTGGFVLTNSHQNINTNSNLLSSITYSSDTKQEYAIEGTINGAGASLTWAKDRWQIDNLQELPWDSVNDVPVFINSVGGLGSPWWKSNVTARFLEANKQYSDYSAQQCKAALMESIIFLIVNNIDEMRMLDIHPTKLIASGGISSDQYFCQRLADLSALPVTISLYKETTSRGAAWLALGRPDWELQTGEPIQPRIDQALAMRYQQFTQAIKHDSFKHRLIAHRGDMTHYPENSMLAIQAAVDLGLYNIEIDIQLSKDGVPIVIHDDNLQRTVGYNKNIYDLTANEISTYLLTHDSHSSDDKSLLHIPTLHTVVTILNNHPDITLFVEIKRQSIEHFGLNKVVNAVLQNLQTAKFNVVIISFVADVVSLVKSHKHYPIGWVVREFNQAHKEQAERMQPDYLFCNINKIDSPESLWKGSWQWALYDVQDPKHTRDLLEQGVAFIETGDIVKLAHAKELH